MAYELAVSEGGMSDEQLGFAKKYMLQNYIKTLTESHRNTTEEIMELEKATRGQAKNVLWKLLRINRTTASGTSGGFYGETTPAMKYGIDNEKLLKKNKIVMSIIREGVEKKLKKEIIEEVLDCGLFLSEIGLYSASPDAYFRLDNNDLVVLEIKCPYTYRNETLESIRLKMNSSRSRYRVPHTAFSVNRHDTLHVAVEKRNDHYRQMQAQLYVTGAVMAVYMVKFSDMPEIHFVPRDEKFIKELADRELIKLKMYANENKRSQIMVMEKERLKSFGGSGHADKIARLLAKNGMYCWCGNVICFFCKQQFEIIDKSIDIILEEHNKECNRQENISMVEVGHERYLNVFDRINNLLNTQKYSLIECEELAKKGYFYNGSRLAFYCCGEQETHKNDCYKIQQ
ncbi:ALK-EXO [Pieris rapae granulovirus Wuhan]|uniref:ALK-EXO n=1 Tax=Pieris rapae granulovirus Wuhan TaxID=2848030 RepID=D2J4S4_9BBAC|nr:ALK-EXO [Betabaculovirus arrapae]ACZ63593.1 ALK-EXO [Betabaculovirus arrapae]ADO85535.1 alk-exo [Pieris rapae granulovirus]UOS85781.1 ALK-EXO [Pieris rapae granulovirus]